MSVRAVRETALVAAVVAAVGWALALTLLQPLTETAAEEAAPNQYWARDLRWMLLLAVGCALVAALRAGARSAAAVGGAGLVLLAVDVALDRAGVDHPLAAVGVAGVAGALTWGLWRALAARSRRPSRGAAMVCAAIAATATSLTPFIAVLPEAALHPSLRPSVMLVGALLAVVTVAATIAAADAPVRRGPLIVLCVLAAACVVIPGDYIVVSVAGALLLTAATVVMRRPGAARTAGILVALLIGFPAAVVAMRLLTYPVGALFVSLAGNTAQSPADDAVFIPAIALLMGATYGGILLLTRPADDRPRPWLNKHPSTIAA